MLERAFAGALVHDIFNVLSVVVLLPVEAATGSLYHLTKALASESLVHDGDKWEDPIRRLVTPLANKVIRVNKDVIKGVANGSSCDSFYPVSCQDPSNPTKNNCTGGLIDCDRKTNKCPFFYKVSVTSRDDEMSGAICFFLALVMILVCLNGLISILQKMLVLRPNRVVYKASNINEYTAMAIGTAITTLVQSSSITTAILTPFVGMDVINLKQMLPMALGANLGNTITVLLASLASDRVESLQVALAFLFFNVAGIFIWYSIPFMRRVPLDVAAKLGRVVHVWRGFPVVYVIVVFLLTPLGWFGLAVLREDAENLDDLGSVVVILMPATAAGLLIMLRLWWCRRRGSNVAKPDTARV